MYTAKLHAIFVVTLSLAPSVLFMHSDVTKLLQSFVVFHLQKSRKLVVFFQVFGHVGRHNNETASATAKQAAVV
jgi:hypothetical protein